MIVENQKSDVVEVVGENTSHTATIDTTRIKKLQYILTEGLYSDAQSAVIVELANNGVDSIVESGKDPIENPVVVELSRKNGSYSISIRDSGIGMDKRFFEDCFMNFLYSTKENSNDYIGAFGIGGKSWASLKRTVTFTIVKNGKKSKYLCWKGEEMIDFDSIIEEEDTDEGNGVLFEMPINDHYEYSQFINKAKQKLSYYDTVVLIIDGVVWSNKIYRNELFQYNTYSPYTSMHLCLKDVVYVLDYDKLGIKPITLPLAIRFGLTEGINVTPSREALLYSKETIALIKERIVKVCDYLTEEFNKTIASPVTFWDFYQRIGNSSKMLSLPDKNLELSYISGYGTVPFSDFTIKGMELRNPLWYKQNMYTLMQFLHMKAEYTYRGVWKIKNIYQSCEGKYASKQQIHMFNGDLRGNVKEYLKEQMGPSTHLASYTNNTVFNLSWYIRNIGLNNIPKDKWRAFIQEWQNVQKQIVKDLCIDMSDIEKTQGYIDWLEERRAAIKAGRITTTGNYKILNKQDGEVTIAYSRKSYIGGTYTFEKSTHKISDLPKTKSMVLVFHEEEREEAREWAGICKREKVAIIGQREFSKIKHIKQFVRIKDFMSKDNKPFRRIATALLAKEVYDKYNTILGSNNSIVVNCLKNVQEDVRLLEEYSNKNSNYYARREMYDEIIGVARTYNLFDEEFMPVIKRMEKNIETFDFIQYIAAPRNWEIDKTKEVTKLINQMLLFRKKYHNQLENYELVYVAPPVEEVVASEELMEEGSPF